MIIKNLFYIELVYYNGSFCDYTYQRKDTFSSKCIDCLQLQTKKPEEIVIIIHEDDEETNKFIKNLNTNLFIRYFKN